MEAGETAIPGVWAVAGLVFLYLAKKTKAILRIRGGYHSTYQGQRSSGRSNESYTSPEILHEFEMVVPQFQG